MTGARVAFTYHRGDAVAQELLPKLPGGIAHRPDLTSVPEIEATVDTVAAQLGGIDAFVQCAALAVVPNGRGPKQHQRLRGRGREQPGTGSWT